MGIKSANRREAHYGELLGDVPTTQQYKTVHVGGEGHLEGMLNFAAERGWRAHTVAVNLLQGTTAGFIIVLERVA